MRPPGRTPLEQRAAHMCFHDTVSDQDVIQDDKNGTEESNLNAFGQAPDEDNCKIFGKPPD